MGDLMSIVTCDYKRRLLSKMKTCITSFSPCPACKSNHVVWIDGACFCNECECDLFDHSTNFRATYDEAPLRYSQGDGQVGPCIELQLANYEINSAKLLS